MDVRLLTPEDAALHAEHALRIMASSGVPPTPIFMARSRSALPPRAKLIEVNQQAWLIPVGTRGWRRSFGYFTSDGSMRGEVGLGERGPPVANHRATLWLGIETAVRGCGVGRRLMETLIEWSATSTSLIWLDLNVFSHNQPARRLYESLGFIENGRVADAVRIDGHSIDDISMSLSLDQYRWTR